MARKVIEPETMQRDQKGHNKRPEWIDKYITELTGELNELKRLHDSGDHLEAQLDLEWGIDALEGIITKLRILTKGPKMRPKRKRSK